MPTFHGTKSLQIVRLMGWIHAGREFEAVEAVQSLFISKKSFSTLYRMLKSCGLARVVRWTHRTIGAPVAVYGWGGGEPDAPKPKASKPCSSRSRLATRMLAAMSPKHAFPPDAIHQVVGTSMENVRKKLKLMVDEGRIHIQKWKRPESGGMAIPYYLPFPGKNAEKPRRMTAAEFARARKRRLKERFGEKYPLIRRTRAQGGVEKLVIDGVLAYQRQGPVGHRRAA